MMDHVNVTEFLLARLAEDEQLAREAVGTSGSVHWKADGYDVARRPVQSAGALIGGLVASTNPGGLRPVARFIAANDPARASARITAIRELVDGLGERPTTGAPDATDYLIGVWAGKHAALLHLAGEYAGHPDYDPSWD